MKSAGLILTVVVLVFISSSVRSQGIPEPVSTVDSLIGLTDKQFTLDSLRVLSWADSLKSKIHLGHSADSLGLVTKIDSLQHLRLPTSRYQHQMDSLIARKDALVTEVDAKKQEVLGKTRGRLQAWREKVAEKMGLTSTNQPDLSGAGLPVGGLTEKIPSVPGADLSAIPNADLPAIDMGALDIPEMPELSIPELQNAELSPDLSSINKSISLPEIDEIRNIQSHLGKGQDAMSTASSLVTDTDKVIDGSLNKISELGEVKEQIALGEGISDNEFMDAAGKMKDPDALKEELKEQAVKKAVNHFEGKEQVLQQAMEQMSKYKAKYESLNSLSEIKKRPPNAMKGKPFIERLVPGVAFQILRKDDLFLDVNPYLGYRISGRFTSGIGWNQRIGYSTKYDHFTSPSVVYGPRWFGEAKVWKGFSGRVEVEVMNTVVPPPFVTPSNDFTQREWVWTAMAGLKKEYRFIKNVRGTAFILFNLYNPQRKSPYGDVMSTRFGFEFPLKKRVKAVKQDAN